MSLLANIITFGSFTFISRIFGFIRDILLAGVIGAGWVADAFFVAFRLSNIFRSLFAEGAFSAAYIPALAQKIQKKGIIKAFDFAAAIIAILILALLVILIISEIFMPWLMILLVPGFYYFEAEKYYLTIDLARILFPFLLCMGIVSWQSSTLNSLSYFGLPSLMPSVLNLSMILALLYILYFVPFVYSERAYYSVYILSACVTFSGLLQILILSFPLRRLGFKWQFRLPIIDKDLVSVFKTFWPAALGAGVYQLNILINMALASFLGAGAISYIYFADRLSQLPLGVIGVAIGTALLPRLSKQLVSSSKEIFNYTQNRGFEYSIFLTLPAALGLFILADPIIEIIFVRGFFVAEDAQATAGALKAFSLGIPAYALIKAGLPGFYARKDTKTPLRIGIFTLLVNVFLSLILINFLSHIGLALATSIAAWFNAIFLLALLYKRKLFIADRRLCLRFGKGLVVNVIFALLLFFLSSSLLLYLDMSGIKNIIILFGFIFICFILYVFLSFIFKVIVLSEIKAELGNKDF